MYTYTISDDFCVAVFHEETLEVIDDPGPFISFEEADQWAQNLVDAINSGKRPAVLPPEEPEDVLPIENPEE